MPFCERLFQLARRRDKGGRSAGWVGQITANSFMKREFGRKLIEAFLPTIDLVEIVDSSGAYITGHGTPTVILVGRNGRQSHTSVRAILGTKSEPSIPEVPSKGLVWTSITASIDDPRTFTDYVTVSDLPITFFWKHPWSLSGGEATSVKEKLDNSAQSFVRDAIARIGFFGDTHADEIFSLPMHIGNRYAFDKRYTPSATRGEKVRDWVAVFDEIMLFPYDSDHHLKNQAALDPLLIRFLYQWRTFLGARRVFGGQTYDEAGQPWYAWHQLPEPGSQPSSICFAFVVTHNHFALDRGGRVFNRSAPVIKLPDSATEDDHLRLLGLLNSSTACFWLKQVSHNKGRPGAEQAGADEPWEHRYEFTGTKLEQFPLPKSYPLELTRKLDSLAQRLALVSPFAVVAQSIPTQERLMEAKREWESVRGHMIALQEELDWEVYSLYGLLDEDLTESTGTVPRILPGERAFEIILAHAMDTGEVETTWFKHHNHNFTPITELPLHWPDGYRELVERRIAVIEERPDLALIERPECKRRWATKPWEEQEREGLRDWVLDRLEEPAFWADPQGRPQPQSVSQLADRVRRDPDLLAVLGLLVGRPDYQLVTELGRLLADEAVPYLAAYRYTDSGLRKRDEWEQVWALQRREDAGEQVGPIPVPPRYKPADFARGSYWQQRGKLDVPKERFVAYPGAERDTDPAAVYGWAGWDHLEQARALATLVLHRAQQDGWAGERLVPLLAGLAELEPWLHQWHDEPDPEYGGSPAEYISAFLSQQLGEVGRTREQLAAWRPETVRRGRGRRRTAARTEARS